MRWEGRRESSNIEDRRGFSAGRVGGIGGAGALIVALIAIYFGQDPSEVLQSLQGAPSSSSSPSTPYQESSAEAQTHKFVAVVLADTEDAWTALFAELQLKYEQPALVLFSGSVDSACGMAQAAMGPFYCSADRKVYIDLSFYDDLKNRFGAPGDFAEAYVIAHEVGHHVQALLGLSDKVQAAQSRASKAQANALSVRVELQADCYAGVWAHNASESRQLIESGDIEEGLNAASAIGDDRLQKQSQGHVTPESFTHGTSAQRVSWFKKGYQKGKIESCDTFSERNL
jgi:predicted metalloprotease